MAGCLKSLQFHADAEKGLGPVVASLSLGSTSHMHFRRSKFDITQEDVPKLTGVLTLVLKHVSPLNTSAPYQALTYD